MCIVGNVTGVELENAISVKTVQLRNTDQVHAGVWVWGFKPHRRIGCRISFCRIVKSLLVLTSPLYCTFSLTTLKLTIWTDGFQTRKKLFQRRLEIWRNDKKITAKKMVCVLPQHGSTAPFCQLPYWASNLL